MRTVEHALAPRRVPPAVPARRVARPRASVACVVGPVLGALALGLAWLIVHPATADLAAQEYRTGLWRREGFAIWDAQWYGGHHEPGYSLLFGPLAALLGPRALGFVAGVVAVAALTVIARRQERFPRLVGWLFAAGVMTNVLIGRVPFVLGIALGALAWLCADARRRRPAMLALAALLALATVWASPPAGLFLALAGAARRLSGERRDTAAAIALAVPPIVGGLAVAVAFPEGGRDHFAASAFWPTFALGLAGLALLDPRRRALRLGVLAALVLLVAAFVVPTSVGQTALRPLVILGPALLALGLRPGGRKVLVAAVVVGAGLLYLQWLPAVRAIAEASGDPSTKSSYYSEVLRIVDREREPGERLEIPLTRNHWEAAVVAPRIPLARGWHRQLDEEANPLFYDRLPLTAGRYEEWLYDRAVRWVALPNVPLDFSARREAALLRSGGVPGLRLVLRSENWTIWEVLPVPPPATGPARLAGAGTDSFQLAVREPGRIRVRATYTPYWTIVRGDGCIERGSDGLTEVVARRAGTLRVEARLSLAGALGRVAAARRLPVFLSSARGAGRRDRVGLPIEADGGGWRPRVLSCSRYACKSAMWGEPGERTDALDTPAHPPPPNPPPGLWQTTHERRMLP